MRAEKAKGITISILHKYDSILRPFVWRWASSLFQFYISTILFDLDRHIRGFSFAFQFYISTILLAMQSRSPFLCQISILHKYDSIKRMSASAYPQAKFQFYISTILFRRQMHGWTALFKFQFYISTILFRGSERPVEGWQISILHKYDSIIHRASESHFVYYISILHKYDSIFLYPFLCQVGLVFQFYISTILLCCDWGSRWAGSPISILHKYDSIGKRIRCSI